MSILSLYEREVMIHMSDSQVSGYALLKKQREARISKLGRLTLGEYFQGMEEIRQGKPIPDNLKRFILTSYN